MKNVKFKQLLAITLVCCILGFNCHSQVSVNKPEEEKLVMVLKISLPNVSGRIDHISYDTLNHIAFMAALGNNTIEVIDVNSGRVIKTLTGLHEPQGVVYISSSNKLIVANGSNGDCNFFDAKTFSPLGTVHLQDDADNVRYDATTGLLYVGYGSGAIAIINANSMNLVAEIPLEGHPESFQFSKKQNRIYINVPEANEIEVADLSTNKIVAKWTNTNASSNFPMTLDEKNNRLYIAYRSPARLKMLDTESGKEMTSVDCSGDADDVFFDPSQNLVFVSAGKGFIDVFRTNEKELVRINHFETRSGARTSLLIKSENKFLLAVPAHPGAPAELWVYKITQ